MEEKEEERERQEEGGRERRRRREKKLKEKKQKLTGIYIQNENERQFEETGIPSYLRVRFKRHFGKQRAHKSK